MTRRHQDCKRIFLGMMTALVVGLMSDPGWSQSTELAPVVLDGNTLFQVSASGQFSAPERASLVNLQLNEAVKSDISQQVRIEMRNQLPTLILNDRYLLTITERDALSGGNPLHQATIWASTIQSAVSQAQRERTPQFLWKTFLLSFIVIATAAAGHWLLGRLHKRFMEWMKSKLNPGEGAGSMPTLTTEEWMLGVVFFLLKGGIWVGILFYISQLFPVTRYWSYWFFNSLTATLLSPIFSVGKGSYSAVQFMVLAGMIASLVAIVSFLTNLLQSQVLIFPGISRGTREGIAVLSKYVLIALGTLVLLQIWGFDISSLTFLAGALGVGIGFGLQEIAKNFSSGLVLVFERPIQVGDFVEVGSFKGTVERIGGRSTEIRTLDQVSIIVPNSRFLETEVINWSHGNPISRLHLPVGVAYGSDPKVVERALLEAAMGQHGVLIKPPPHVFFQGFGDSALNFELLVWTREPNRQFWLKSDLNHRIYAALKQADIQIPFPQHDLHIRSGVVKLSSSV